MNCPDCNGSFEMKDQINCPLCGCNLREAFDDEDDD